ncbi:DNA polymerase III subunit gamma/tau [Rhodospirillaceae bacterium]|nr:DNA polymerase III subunit gamma/tau [Rhodospirillaceae bacterium]
MVLHSEGIVDAMEYRVLARKYRPQNFTDLIGQDVLVRTLSNAISQSRLAHAFILTGVRGVGKTTTARIIAKGINCIGADGNGSATIDPCGVCANCTAIMEDRHVDVMEMDAASRTGVDDIREILDGVRYKPVTARNKVYIIDEVHMLSRNAFNALLKTLEEPPENVKFIFATTEIRKVPVTVLSRCQRFDLKRLGIEDLARLFATVCQKENVTIERDALYALGRAADGSARDGLSLLDQSMALSVGEITAEVVQGMLGSSDRANILDLFEKIMSGDIKTALNHLEKMNQNGVDPLSIVQDLLEVVHLVTRCKVQPDYMDVNLSESEKQMSFDLAQKAPMVQLGRAWQMLLKGIEEVQTSFSPFSALEMLIIRLVYLADKPDVGLRTSPVEVEQKKKVELARDNNALLSIASSTKNVQNINENDPNIERCPSNFIEIVDMFEKKREAIIHANLIEKVKPVRVEAGLFEIEDTENIDSDLPGRIARLLSEWTGTLWQIALVQSTGEKTLREKMVDAELEAKENAKNDPIVASVLSNFPGAEIKSVRKIVRHTDCE